MPFKQERQVELVIGPLNLHLNQGVMPPDEIKLWEGNPRIKHLLPGLGSYPSEEDLMALIKKVQPTAYRNLYRDIERFGQQEPVFLHADRSNGRIETGTVIEGNTRVTILKELHSRRPSEQKFASVKAYILPEDFGEDDEAILMANYHVKGTLRNQWDRYQIGAFLHEHIEDRKHFNQNQMAEFMGKSPSWVSRHLTVYKFALDFRDELEGTFGLDAGEAEERTNRYFSILEEAWKVKAFRDEMDRSPEAKETLFRWVHGDRFRDHRKVRAIQLLYSDPARRQQVDDGGIGSGDDAAERLDKAIPLHDELDRLLRRVEGVQIGDLDSIDRRKVRRVLEALENLEQMLHNVGVRK
jgi:hypothetical protein